MISMLTSSKFETVRWTAKSSKHMITEQSKMAIKQVC